jgi:hypothetical protein
MPSVNMIWSGSDPDRERQLALIRKLVGLAPVATGSVEPAAGTVYGPALEGRGLEGRVLVGESVLVGSAREGLEPLDFVPTPTPPIELNVIGMPRPRTIGEQLYVVEAAAALTGLEFTLFDPRRLYPGDDRVSFVFARAAGCPALDGQLVLVEDRSACARYQGTPVAEGDWYLTQPWIHLRYFGERWMDLLLAWVKRFYVRDLVWWRHDDMPGWEEFVALTQGYDPGEAREAAFDALKVLFRQELAQWRSPEGPSAAEAGADPIRAGMTRYLTPLGR